jgi:hypothetical protein
MATLQEKQSKLTVEELNRKLDFKLKLVGPDHNLKAWLTGWNSEWFKLMQQH